MGDIVDCRDETMGAWFEAKIMNITKRTDDERQEAEQSNGEAVVANEEKSNSAVLVMDQNENSVKADVNECCLKTEATASPKTQVDESDKNVDHTSAENDGSAMEVDPSVQESENQYTVAKNSESQGAKLTQLGPDDDGYTYHVMFDG